MGKKIGILTHYHKSNNFGGILQAYALAAYINENNINEVTADQLTYHVTFEKRSKRELIESGDFWKAVKWNLRCKIISLMSKFKKKTTPTIDVEARKTKNQAFREMIPHSKEVLQDDFTEVEKDYDMFIAGSDQVWNPIWFNKACYLNFASEDKIKVAYAASMGVNSLTKTSEEKMLPLIEEFGFISVREKKAQEILKQYLPHREIEVVVDPVFLLTKQVWDNVAKDVITDKKYIYTYLLGGRKINREMTEKACDILELPLATIPYVHMKYNDYDETFGDIQVTDAGPAEFLGLIKNAEVIVTDSFHALAFSIIFNKNFVVLKRDKDKNKVSMNSRVENLLNELHLGDRIVSSPDELTKEILNKDVDYTYANVILESNREKSADFLRKALGVE